MAYLLLKWERRPERCTKGQSPGQPQKRPMKSSIIFISTYNESDDLERPCDELSALELSADIHFCDDTSPNGTGEMIALLVNEAEATSQIGLAA
jgi:hypothetical protein